MGGSLSGIMAKPLDCVIDVSKSELRSLYYVHFRTNAPREKFESSYRPQLQVKSFLFYEDSCSPK